MQIGIEQNVLRCLDFILIRIYQGAYKENENESIQYGNNNMKFDSNYLQKIFCTNLKTLAQ